RTIFFYGSRSISRLNPQLRERINNILSNNFDLFDKNYTNNNDTFFRLNSSDNLKKLYEQLQKNCRQNSILATAH
ncbi:MAG: hypothetical protein ACFN40_04850, partial [Bacteroidota bacterium]